MYPNLKLQMWRSGIRQNRLAKMLGVHESVLSKIVNGFRKPTPEMRTQIAAALRQNEAWLFEARDDAPPAVGSLAATALREPSKV